MVVAHIFGIALGIAFIYGGVHELVQRLRLQRKLVRAQGVFVGHDDVAAHGAGIHARAGRFRFVTQDGRTVESVSAMYSFPGPKPGRPVTVVYDPARPERTAERLGVHRFLLVAGGPMLMAIGMAMLIVNVQGL